MGDLYIIMMRAANYHIFIHYSIVYCAVFYVVINCKNDVAPWDMICMDVYVEYRYTGHIIQQLSLHHLQFPSTLPPKSLTDMEFPHFYVPYIGLLDKVNTILH